MLTLLVAGVTPLVLAGACAQQMDDKEAFPGYDFGEGKNNMLDYPEDSGRTEYTGTRLNSRSKDHVVSTVTDSSKQTVLEPSPAQQVILDDAMVEIDQTTPMQGSGDAIQPTPLLSGDVELENIQALDVKPELGQSFPPTADRPRETAMTDSPAITAEWSMGVFLASYRSEAGAETGWRDVSRKYSEELGGLGVEILEVDLGPAKGGIYYRLFAVPLEGEQRARALCQSLEQKKQFCRVATSGGRIKW